MGYRSALRGKVTMFGLYVFKYKKLNGDFPVHLLFGEINIMKKMFLKMYALYTIII